MANEDWSVETLPAFQKKDDTEVDWLWSASLPPNRDNNPAVWDTVIGFFEDAITASCSRPGKLVVTPREILKQLKHNGREPSSAMNVITELFNRGDIVRADSLKPPSKSGASQTPYTFGSLRASLTSYIWGSTKATPPSLDDPIVPVAALKAAADRASSLSGPMASADIHTVKTFAAAITADSTRDAEAVIAHIVSRGDAAALFTDVTPENPEAILGVKLGRGKPQAGDKGVLHTKAALEKMEDTASHLEVAVEGEKTAAMTAAKAGNKGEALARLRKKKVFETKLASARSAGAKLSEVLMAVDEAESNREAVVALETGMASLKTATADGVTADRIDTVAADFDDMMAEQQDVRVAFEQLNMDAMGNDAALEAELDDLVNEDKAQVQAQALAQAQAQAAGKGEDAGASSEAAPISKLADEAEEELARLLAELPTPTPYGGSGATGATGAEEEGTHAQSEEGASNAVPSAAV